MCYFLHVEYAVEHVNLKFIVHHLVSILSSKLTFYALQSRFRTTCFAEAPKAELLRQHSLMVASVCVHCKNNGVKGIPNIGGTFPSSVCSADSTYFNTFPYIKTLAKIGKHHNDKCNIRLHISIIVSSSCPLYCEFNSAHRSLTAYRPDCSRRE